MEERRFDVGKGSDNVPIAVLAVTQKEDGTDMVVTAEPHAERLDQWSDYAGALALAESLFQDLNSL